MELEEQLQFLLAKEGATIIAIDKDKIALKN